MTASRSIGQGVTVLAGLTDDPDQAPSAWHPWHLTAYPVGGTRPVETQAGIGDGYHIPHATPGQLTITGQATAFADPRGLGLALTALFGRPTNYDGGQAPTTGARGYIRFLRLPADGQTVELNGVTWTLVTGGPPAPTETTVQATIAATVALLAADLNASGDPAIAEASYAAAGPDLIISHDTPGAGGEAYTLAAAGGVAVSAPTLRGAGLRRHHWQTGASLLPCLWVEATHTGWQAGRPGRSIRHSGLYASELTLQSERSGTATIGLQLTAQIEESLAALPARAPSSWPLAPFAHSAGVVAVDGVSLASVSQLQVTLANGLITLPPRHADEAFAAADPGTPTAAVQITARYADDSLRAAAEAEASVAITHRLRRPDGAELLLTLPRVQLPRTRPGIAGPEGVEVTYAAQPLGDAGTPHATVELINDVAAY